MTPVLPTPAVIPVQLSGRLRATTPVVTADKIDALFIGDSPGYKVIPVFTQGAARVMLVSSTRQKTNPDPGSTVAIELSLTSGFQTRHFKAASSQA